MQIEPFWKQVSDSTFCLQIFRSTRRVTMPIHRNFFCTFQSTRSEPLNLFTLFIRYCHFQSNPSSYLVPSQRIAQTSVAILWDLETKPPKSVSLFEAAGKVKTAASSFGLVRHMVAYVNRRDFSYVPQVVGEQRIRDEPNICRVCGRKFYTKEKLLNHFKIHVRENVKRLNQIESARGSRMVNLVSKYSMKMEKYKNDRVGNSLVNELKRAGFGVRSLPDYIEEACDALRKDIVNMMNQRRFECLVIVSDDSGFVDVVMGARLRCLKTVVVGNLGDGALKRAAVSGFSWGEAKIEALSVVGQYKPEEEKGVHILDDVDGDNADEAIECIFGGINDSCLRKDDTSSQWWELHSDPDDTASPSCR